MSAGGHGRWGGSEPGVPARGRWPEPCGCRWGHYVLFVFLFLGWKNKQGSGFSAVSLQLTNRAHHSAGVAHSVRGDDVGTERGASLSLRGGWEEVMTRFIFFCCNLRRFPCLFPVEVGSTGMYEFLYLLATIQNGSFLETASAQGAGMPLKISKSHVDLMCRRVCRELGNTGGSPESRAGCGDRRGRFLYWLKAG